MGKNTQTSGHGQAGQDTAPRDLCGRMHAILLAGDHAWGGSFLDQMMCRPLIDVAGRPLISHILEWVRNQGIRSASVCANSYTTVVRHALGDGRQVGFASLDYYVDVMPRGPAGCVRDAGADSDGEPLVVICGMSLPRLSISDLINTHIRQKAVVTVLAVPAADVTGQPLGMLEPAGIYIFSREALQHIPTTGYQDIKEALLPRLRAAGKRVCLHQIPRESILRVIDTESYMAATMRVIEEDGASAECPGDQHVNEARIHPTGRVDPSARIVGPVVVGPGCVVEREALLIGPVALGAGCYVGPGAVVSRSILWSRCRIEARAVLDSCLVSDDSVVDCDADVRNTVWTRSRPAPRHPCSVFTGIWRPAHGPTVQGQRLAS